VDCGVDLLRRRGAFLPAGLDAGQPVVAAARGVAVAVAVAAAALTAGLGSATAPSTVTGAGTGFCLLAFGLATLLIGGRAPPRQTSLFRAKGVSMYG